MVRDMQYLLVTIQLLRGIVHVDHGYIHSCCLAIGAETNNDDRWLGIINEAKLKPR